MTASNIAPDNIWRTEGFVHSATLPDGATAVRHRFEHLLGDDIIVAVWKGEPGLYELAEFPGDETIIILEGKATITVGSAPPRETEPGLVLQVGHGDLYRLDIQEELRMICVARYPEALPQ